MPAALEILAWGRIDPYYVWTQATGFADAAGPQDGWLPLLVGAASPAAGAELRQKLKAEFGERVACPSAHAGASCFTLHVKQGDAAALLRYLCGLAACWELGLPLTQRAAAPLGPAVPKRAGTARQIVGFIDYGCAFAHRQFRAWTAGGPTLASRVLALWDQPGDSSNSEPAASAGLTPPAWVVPPEFGYGVEWLRTAAGPGLGIDAYMAQFAAHGAIDEERCYRHAGYRGVDRPEAHGTYVMDLAVGHPDPLPGADVSAPPPDHDIVFVQLPRLKINRQEVTWLLRAQVLDAIGYIFGCARPDQPVTINLSYGSYAGPHDGSTMLERALDTAIAARRAQGGPTDLVIAGGNAGGSRVHVAAPLSAGGPAVALTWSNPPGAPTDQFTEIWFDGPGAGCEVRFAPPGQQVAAATWVSAGGFQVLEAEGRPVAMLVAPHMVGQSPTRRMVLFAVGPTTGSAARPAAPYGDWTLEIRNRGSAPAHVQAWIERNDPVSTSADDPRQARFQGPMVTPYDTLNSLGHGRLPILVGGQVGDSGRVPGYCSRGSERTGPQGQLLPSLNMPGPGGVPRNGPEWLALSEESEADPGVAGAAVLGRQQVRRSGTSVACAVATRYIVQQRARGVTGMVPPPPTRGSGEWALPRLP